MRLRTKPAQSFTHYFLENDPLLIRVFPAFFVRKSPSLTQIRCPHLKLSLPKIPWSKKEIQEHQLILAEGLKLYSLEYFVVCAAY